MFVPPVGIGIDIDTSAETTTIRHYESTTTREYAPSLLPI